MQADLILFVRNEVSPRDEDYPHARWYPHSLVYASDRSKPFEIFARAQSKAYFDSVKVALGVENLNELIRLTNDLHSGERRAPRWNFDTPYLPTLMNVENLATRT